MLARLRFHPVSYNFDTWTFINLFVKLFDARNCIEGFCIL